MIPEWIRGSMIMTRMGGIFALAVAMVFMGCEVEEDNAADLVLTDGQVVTVDDAQPEAEAVAITGSEIVDVGTTDEMDAYIGNNTEVVDLDGRLTIPGFIEGHGHFTGIGDAELQLGLLNVSSWQAIVDMVAEAAEEADEGEVIRGRGWHQEDWDEPADPSVDGLPVHDALSEAAPDNPVLLTHASGHMSFANAEAMRIAGVTAETEDPDGGEIVRDAEGEPTGAFRQEAQGLLSPVRELWDPDTSELADMAAQEALSKGVTTIQDAGTPFSTLEDIETLARDGELGVRLWMMVRDDNERLREHLEDFRMTGVGDNFLTIGGVKKSIDGALGTHGAWMLEPYADRPDMTGFNTTPLDELEEAARLAYEHDYQMATHAIGDRANRETLDLYEEIFEASDQAGTELRWRVEHAQHLHPDDIPRFGEMGVIASMQAVHATSDGPWVPDRVGEERAEQGAYVWRSLWDTEAVVTNGTDAPVEDIDPIESYHSMVTRHLADSTQFFPEQTLDREEALEAYTINNAYAAFQEDIKGSITPGKLADIVVLSDDILSIPDEEIPDTEVDMTILDGEIAYERE